jgi:predicted phage-related endonuclease
MGVNRQLLLKQMATGIGGSEVQHLWSLAPYGCRRQLWYRKTGQPEDHPFAGNKDTERGLGLEWVVAERYRLATGRRTRPGGFRRHPGDPWLLCHPDRLVYADRSGRPAPQSLCGPGILEIKCPTVRGFLRVRREGLPESWLLQLQHGLLVTGLAWGAFAVFSAELWELIEFDVPADPELHGRIRAEARRFWEQERANGPAPEALPMGESRCASCTYRTTCKGAALLAGLLPDEREAATYDEALAPLAREYLEARDLVEQAEQLKENARLRLAEAMGQRQRARTAGASITFLASERSTLDAAGLRKDHPALAAQYERRSVLRSLKVIAG